MEKNIPMITPSNSSKNKCEDCDKTYKTPATLRIHRMKAHPKVDENQEVSSREEDEDADISNTSIESLPCGQGDNPALNIIEEDKTEQDSEIDDTDNTANAVITPETTPDNSTVTKCAGCHLNEVKLDLIVEMLAKFNNNYL